MHFLWSSAHADDNSGPGGLLLEEIPGILIGADREPVCEITIRQPRESADHPAEEMSERRDYSKNLTGTIRIQRCAKSFVLQVYDVLRGTAPPLTYTFKSSSARLDFRRHFRKHP